MTGPTRTDRLGVQGGASLRRLCWGEGAFDAAVAIVHGLAEHADRYGFVAQWLVERGYRVYAYDQRGHGESDGPRTHASSFALLLDDLERFLESVRTEAGTRPVLLLGHSMGGLEVASLLALRRPEISAAVLSGPALALGPGVGRGRLSVARVLSRIAPRVRFPAGIDPEALSRDPAVQEAYRTDPLIPRSITVRLASELFGAVQRVQSLAPGVRRPLLILHGEADPLCPADGSRRFCRAVTGAPADVRVYPGLRHEILNEPERERVLEDLVSWIRRAVPGLAA